MLISRHKGFSLITVVVMLVVLGSAAAYLMQLYAMQQNTVNLRLQHVRAQLAADAGMAFLKASVPIFNPSCKNAGATGRYRYDSGVSGSSVYSNAAIDTSAYPPELQAFTIDLAIYCIGRIGTKDVLKLESVAYPTNGPQDVTFFQAVSTGAYLR